MDPFKHFSPFILYLLPKVEVCVAPLPLRATENEPNNSICHFFLFLLLTYLVVRKAAMRPKKWDSMREGRERDKAVSSNTARKYPELIIGWWIHPSFIILSHSFSLEGCNKCCPLKNVIHPRTKKKNGEFQELQIKKENLSEKTDII